MRFARTSMDVALGGVVLALLAYSAHQLATVWGPQYWILDAVAGAVVGVIALLRRHDRWRAAVAGLAIAVVTGLVAWTAGLPTEPGPAMALALAVLVGSGIAALPTLQACAVAGGGLIVAAGSVLIGHSSGIGTVNAIGWLVAVAAGSSVRIRDVRRHAAAERIRQDERLELARELHDVVAHHISGIVLQAQGGRIAGRRTPSQYDESLAGIEAAGAEALAAMRRMVGLLRSDDVVPGPVRLDELRELVERFQDRGPAVELHLPATEPSWPPEVMITVCRVVQESLTNVARHAPQTPTVKVRVAQVRNTVAVEVVDDAEPTTRHQRAGYGLIGLRERVEALGGTLDAGPGPTGWAVSASVPLEPAR
ncbi:sensor histidine kinase [Kribbella sp. NPDC059898]|uniref:sensor histidine kinase n=1 Tax=Kribbella sp. NPDC059898 TaxID=3346995 RepID=UPI0036501802